MVKIISNWSALSRAFWRDSIRVNYKSYRIHNSLCLNSLIVYWVVCCHCMYKNVSSVVHLTYSRLVVRLFRLLIGGSHFSMMMILLSIHSATDLYYYVIRWTKRSRGFGSLAEAVFINCHDRLRSLHHRGKSEINVEHGYSNRTREKVNVEIEYRYNIGLRTVHPWIAVAKYWNDHFTVYDLLRR